MSHFVTINTQIKDLDALRSALKEMGLSLFPQAQARGYENNQIKGDFVIRLKGPYDIALNKQPDSTYGLSCDWFMGHVEKEVGKHYSKLLQLYAAHKAMREARKKGYSIIRKAQAHPATGWEQTDMDALLQTKWEGLYSDDTIYHVATPAMYRIEGKWYLYAQACPLPGNGNYIDGHWDLWCIACQRLIPTLPGCESIYIPGQPTAAEAVR